MIKSFIGGRLGNQFFRYAFARSLRYARGEKDDFLFSFTDVGNGSKTDGFDDQLKEFNVLDYKITENHIFLKEGTLWQRFLFGCDKLYGKIVGREGRSLRWIRFMDSQGCILGRPTLEDQSVKVPKTKDVLTRGTFEYPEYFKAIKPILMKEFTPRHEKREENRLLYEIIEKRNSVCVHVRRGDFVISSNQSTFLVCDPSYYERAISIMKSLVDDPVFIFFSNDIGWAKENIKIDGEVYYESGNDPMWEIARLMYSCKHFIMSNSTLSWWAQYLCRNENKVVVAPDHWFANTPYNMCLLDDERFVKLPTFNSPGK